MFRFLSVILEKVTCVLKRRIKSKSEGEQTKFVRGAQSSTEQALGRMLSRVRPVQLQEASLQVSRGPR